MFKTKQKRYSRQSRSRDQVFRSKKNVSRHSAPRRREAARAKFTVLLIFFGASLLWFVYFFLFSDNFRIITVGVSGLENIPSREMDGIIEKNLARRHWFLFPNSNIFIFSKKSLADDIGQKYILESIAVKKKLPSFLDLEIREKLARLVLRTLSEIKIETEPAAATSTEAIEPSYAEKFFYLDVNGIVVSEESQIPEDILTSLPVIQVKYQGPTPVKPGDNVIARDKIAYIQEIYEELKKPNLNIKIAYVGYDPKLKNELKLATKEGWQIFINSELNVPDQLKKLELALAEKIKDKRRVLQYVDLRINDRVYYK